MTFTHDTRLALVQIGEALSLARKSRQMTIKSLAERIGVDRRTISSLEHGNPAVSFGVFVQTLSVFNILEGIQEFLSPENDMQATLENIRTLRLKKKAIKKITDEEVAF
ncbi:MAG: helix-turn-helix transcriptional regulator [Deltaproteobacteria bacterium]|nr:helix-turn-helix transcriptional regulator [Deltaproteobacteria bacterium]